LDLNRRAIGLSQTATRRREQRARSSGSDRLSIDGRYRGGEMGVHASTLATDRWRRNYSVQGGQWRQCRVCYGTSVHFQKRVQSNLSYWSFLLVLYNIQLSMIACDQSFSGNLQHIPY
jgi:hypothetical protein